MEARKHKNVTKEIAAIKTKQDEIAHVKSTEYWSELKQLDTIAMSNVIAYAVDKELQRQGRMLKLDLKSKLVCLKGTNIVFSVILKRLKPFDLIQDIKDRREKNV